MKKIYLLVILIFAIPFQSYANYDSKDALYNAVVISLSEMGLELSDENIQDTTFQFVVAAIDSGAITLEQAITKYELNAGITLRLRLHYKMKESAKRAVTGNEEQYSGNGVSLRQHSVTLAVGQSHHRFGVI